MQRISAIDPSQASGKGRQLLDAVQAKLGITPNLMKTLATAPAALEAYLNFSGALDRKSTRLNSSHIQKSRMPSSA